MNSIPWTIEQLSFFTIILGTVMIEILKMLIIKIKVNRCTGSIEATAVDCKKVYITRWGKDLVYYHVIAEYMIDGIVYRCKSFSKRFCEYEVGEKIHMKYSKKNPKICYDEGYDFINNIRGEYYNEPAMTIITKGYIVLLALFIILIIRINA